jgi:LAO/AO transport system kinase
MESSTLDILEGIKSGNRFSLSKGITLVESQRSDHLPEANALTRGCFETKKTAIRIGITGVPGVGKSTFIDAFGSHLTGLGLTVAVLAIDPSSQRSKGSILGDKTRMDRLSADPRAYIRPSPSNLNLGGVNSATRQSIILCEAAGFDVVIVETVGVGQSETEVYNMVDFFLLLMIAGAGDELQGIKRGVMELAHAIFINKSDIDEKAAKLAAQEYRSALKLYPPLEPNWETPVVCGSSLTEQNIPALWKMIETFGNDVGQEALIVKRREQDLRWMQQSIADLLVIKMSSDSFKEQLVAIETQVLNGEVTAFEGLQRSLEEIMANR